MKIKTGEIWEIISRGFGGDILLKENINTDEDTFFEAEIIEGEKYYLNSDIKKKGDIISFRTDLTTFVKQKTGETKK